MNVKVVIKIDINYNQANFKKGGSLTYTLTRWLGRL